MSDAHCQHRRHTPLPGYWRDSLFHGSRGRRSFQRRVARSTALSHLRARCCRAAAIERARSAIARDLRPPPVKGSWLVGARAQPPHTVLRRSNESPARPAARAHAKRARHSLTDRCWSQSGTLCPVIFGRDVLTLDKTDFAQTAMKAGQIGRHPVRRFAIEESTGGIARRCARHDRPCRRRAAEQRNELAPPHSMTSSARGQSGRFYIARFRVKRAWQADLTDPNLMSERPSQGLGLPPNRAGGGAPAVL